MAGNPNQQKLWKMAAHGWKLSIIVGLAVLLIRFKALIPLVWQILVQGGTTRSVGNVLKDLLGLVAIIGGIIVFVYAVRIGYRRANQALELSGNSPGIAGNNPSSSTVALRVIGRVSLLVNAPILYWALFLFVLLPQLVKIPNASLRIGTTAALAGAFISMAVIVVVATHVGLLLTKFSFRSITKAPELAAALGAVTGLNQPLPFGQQGAYIPQLAYSDSQQTAGPTNQAAPYGQQGGYYPVVSPDAETAVATRPLAYTQQGAYVQPAVGRPVAPQAPGVDNDPANQTPPGTTTVPHR